MSAATEVLMVVAIVGAGVVTGMLLIFSVAVMPALERQGSEAGAAAMVAINEVILNPVFLMLFMGTAIVSVAAGVVGWMEGAADRAWIAAGAIVWVVGVFGVTAAVNVPLNERLAAVEPRTREAEELWAHYLDRWVRWNTIRSIAGIVATALLAMAATGG